MHVALLSDQSSGYSALNYTRALHNDAYSHAVSLPLSLPSHSPLPSFMQSLGQVLLLLAHQAATHLLPGQQSKPSHTRS